MMQFKGVIESIIYRNIENGYTVLSVAIEDHLETVVGVCAPITEGEEIEITGEFVKNDKFGQQIKAESIISKPPQTKDGIVKYLSSDLFKGVGEKTAMRIVDKFGEETFKIIEKEPIKLAQIHGITPIKAKELGEKYAELKAMQETIIYLQKYDISLNLSLKIFKRYQSNTINTIKNNPYKLVYDIHGIGFFTADTIALKVGLEKDSQERIQASICYILNSLANKTGDTLISEKKLIDDVYKLIKIEDDYKTKIKEEIVNLEDTLIQAFMVDEDKYLMLKKFYDLEKNIAENLFRIKRSFDEKKLDVNTEIDNFEKVNKIKLHLSQRSAIASAINNGVMIITGGPGTGKTTIIKAIISIFKSRRLSISLCAPTGRASKRLSEATNEVASTIHRMLDLDFSDGKGHFKFNENQKLSSKVIIVDEVSMVDEYIFNSLLKAIEYGARLILVGDKDQLPSVGAGNILSDLLESKLFKVNELTEIYRQANDSYIISNAHRINKGKMPVLDIKEKNNDFFYKNLDEQSLIADNATSMCAYRIPNFLNIPSKNVQVLCPMKKGLAGVNNLNKMLQKTINKNTFPTIVCGENTFRVGDKVIQNSNNYQLSWSNEYGESGEGVFNGDIGIIHSIDKKNSSMIIKFEDTRLVEYSSSDIEELSLAYAITIHKSQGSEFDVVIIPISPGSGLILTRNLLYTAITRAKKMVVLIGSKKMVSYMVHNNKSTKRMTSLVRFLNEENEIV